MPGTHDSSKNPPFKPANSGPRPPVSIDLGGGERESDEVTEMFLGEGSAVPASRPAPHAGRTKSIAEPLTAWKVVGRPEDPSEDERSPMPFATGANPFDRSAVPASPSASVQVEAIVQGHLPVFAAAWVTQYARCRAEELQAMVGLLRVRQGSLSAECLVPAGNPAVSMAPAADLATAIDLARGLGVRHWIVQTDEVSEPDLWKLSGVRRITILTGADEAALVACYRALKAIAQATAANETEIHVAVMGAPPEKAGPAIERVTRAGENFLGRTVSGSAAASKIGAGAASSLYRSSTETLSLDFVVASLTKTTAADAVHAHSAANTRAATVQRELAAMRQSLMEAKPSEPLRFTIPAAPAAEPVETTEAAGADPAATNAAPTRPASLIGLLDDIAAVALCCPAAPGVDFGIAPDGRLHLAAHVDGELNSGHPCSQARAVEDLTVAAAWAAAHTRMLLSAHATLRLDDRDHAPILHLVTPKPREARRLLDTNIRVHLLLPPQESQWISMDLN